MPNSLNGKSKNTLTEVMDMVANALTLSGKYGLQTEVIAVALIFMEENPNATIQEALNAGLGDWDI